MRISGHPVGTGSQIKCTLQRNSGRERGRAKRSCAEERVAMSFWNWILIPSDPASYSLGLLWPPGFIWLHAVSDAVIGLTCLGIPPVLLWLVRRRPDLEFRSAFYLDRKSVVWGKSVSVRVDLGGS